MGENIPQFCNLSKYISTCSLVLHLFSTVLLDTVVDITQSSSSQHVGRLLVDQSVKVSLDLENVRESGLKSIPGLHRETNGTCG